MKREREDMDPNLTEDSNNDAPSQFPNPHALFQIQKDLLKRYSNPFTLGIRHAHFGRKE